MTKKVWQKPEVTKLNVKATEHGGWYKWYRKQFCNPYR